MNFKQNFRTLGRLVAVSLLSPPRHGPEHVLLLWNRLRCALARRSARRDAKSDWVISVERRNEAGARPRATLRAGGFCVAGSSKGSTVGHATLFALLLPATQNPHGVGVSIGEERALRSGRKSWVA